jgi:hypothetical protein
VVGTTYIRGKKVAAPNRSSDADVPAGGMAVDWRYIHDRHGSETGNAMLDAGETTPIVA